MPVIYKIIKPYAGTVDANRALWIAKMMPASEPSAKKIGITPEAIIAQAALESGWGRAAIGNNLFGIKADGSWKGARQTVPTREVINGQDVFINAEFRDYPTLQASIDDHFDFLVKNTRYRDAGVFHTNSDSQYFRALQSAGYATDPNYAVVLGQVLNTVQSYTKNMERVELADGYTLQSDGSVKSVPPAQSSIVKDSNKGTAAVSVAGVAAVATPMVSAFGALDWKVALIVGVVAVIAIGSSIYYFTRIKSKRVEMSDQGVL